MAQWITDGSIGFTVDGNVVTLADPNYDDCFFNAMWQEGDGVSSGKHYWKIQFPTLASSAGVGFTSKNLFKKGGACNAIIYSGHLSNCGGLLAFEFGPRPKMGDEIGILAVFEGDRLKVYIDVNERNLGLVFDVPSSIFDAIFPMVSLGDSGSVTCTKQSAIPDDFESTPVTIEADWKLVNLQTNGTPLDIPCEVPSRIKKYETDEYRWFVKVFNGISCNFSKVDGAWKITSACNGGNFCPPEFLNFESLVEDLMTSASNIDVDADGNLSVRNDQTSSTWTRFGPEPFVGDPFLIVTGERMVLPLFAAFTKLKMSHVQQDVD